MAAIDPEALNSISFTASHASSLRAIGEHLGRQALFSRQSPEILQSLQDVAVIESTESSNRLEGIVAKPKRIRELVTKSARPRNRSEQEIAGYQGALSLVHESAAHMPLSTNIILQLHSTIYRYMPDEGGRWKQVDNSIVEKDASGQVTRVRFKTVSAFLTPSFMDRIVGQYRDLADGENYEALVLVPLFILDFLYVHPFRDGNGRTARLLTLLLLYQRGYSVGRYISLERIFEESKESYYETLEASSKGWHEGSHDPLPWLTYFWGVILRAYKEFEDRVGTIRTGRGAKTDHVRAAVERRNSPFAISEIQADCPGVSLDMIRRVLRQLRDEGSLRLEGTGRGAKWSRIR